MSSHQDQQLSSWSKVDSELVERVTVHDSVHGDCSMWQFIWLACRVPWDDVGLAGSCFLGVLPSLSPGVQCSEAP